jgi:hypothetical protein
MGTPQVYVRKQLFPSVKADQFKAFAYSPVTDFLRKKTDGMNMRQAHYKGFD